MPKTYQYGGCDAAQDERAHAQGFFPFGLGRDRLGRGALPAGIVRFSGYHSTDNSLIFAAPTITTIPIMIFYFICQRHVMRGLTAAVAE